jgi:hypothetical protein
LFHFQIPTIQFVQFVSLSHHVYFPTGPSGVTFASMFLDILTSHLVYFLCIFGLTQEFEKMGRLEELSSSVGAWGYRHLQVVYFFICPTQFIPSLFLLLNEM